MKREELLQKINTLGAVFVRHGRKHDIYENPHTHRLTQIPRHPKINDYTARDIINRLSK
ncbi:MAG: type II toxin-antitoxin system HicA family toxin [Treponema sp.]|nr:type II toxin-antitoxin system HicA family toxin [Treponema sp.]